jgi:hypothetical protein
LAAEALSALLAADLNLPVPDAYIVRLSPDFVESVPEESFKRAARESCEYAFGSKLAGPGFSIWDAAKKVPKELVPLAAKIFAFDVLIENADRRPGNPNCLYRDSELRVFDHEAAFPHYLPLLGGGWPKPWVRNALEDRRGKHLFSQSLRGQTPDLSDFREAWLAISDKRIEAYGQSLPQEWCQKCAGRALKLIADIRTNIVPALTEVSRIME